MKTVFTDISAIAHLWANKLQDSARTSSNNFYFDRNVIYSYGRHFPIAKHVANDSGENATLITERTYSNTTAKHISVVRQAASHKNLIYCFNPESSHDENFNSWTIEVENIAKNLLKAKKPEKYLSQISIVANKAKNYATFFGLAIPEKLTTVLAIGNKDEFAQYESKKIELENKAKLKAKKELAAKHKQELKKWLNNETNRLYYRNGFDYLRLNNERIETTQAVQIPLELGKRLFQQIQSNTLTVGSKVLDFEVSEVGKNIKIGCHTFTAKYLLEFGSKVFAN